MSDGAFDPDELVRWAENYGHPEEWVQRAQAAHGRAERRREAILRLLDADQDGYRISPENEGFALAAIASPESAEAS